MASMANLFSTLLFVFFLISPFQIHARDSQFFNKMPNNVVVVNKEQTTVAAQEQQQPSFMPESENGGYGLYGRESTTQQKNKLPYQGEENLPNKKYLPKNYNPVAYVTAAPDDNASKGKQQMTKMSSDSFEQSKDKYYTNGGNNYFNNQKKSFPSATTTAAMGGGYRYNSNNGGFQKQGMSDTRFLDNGKYYYGGNNGDKSPKNPFDNSRNEFGNSKNFNNNNFMGNSYQNEDFEDEDDDDLP